MKEELDEIDLEMEKMLIPKQVRTFQQYLGVQMAKEPEPSIDEQLKDLEWESTPYHKAHWKKVLRQFLIIEGVLWGLCALAFLIWSNRVANLVIEIGVFITLIVFVILSAKDLVEYSTAEEEFKNAK